ncbi:MAG: AmmeMemoRadiSam system protein B, partial [Candidatus Omnitrophica bacterium]|nr:AmmeMemoRadiSam system protein B [Candidatus Omnitrophota bacterium]
AQQIKKPNVSGAFYPNSAKILAERIKQFLAWAEVEKQDKDILALISPHAGYDYSGSVAAFGFKAIKDRPIRTVIVIGPSHFLSFDGISVYPEGAWQTPLGNVPVDTELAEALIQNHPKISFNQPAFAKEHSVEVELPFLQIVLDEFQIVPIVMGEFSYENCEILSQALLEIIDDREDVLVVASTDMSHYHSYAQANQIDSLTIEELKQFKVKSLYERLVTGESELCGSAAVITTLLYTQARGASELKILKYANSGDVSADKQRVVGYLSAAIYGPEARRVPMANQAEDFLNQQQKQRLLEIASQTIDQYVTDGRRLEFAEDAPLLLKKMGAFVTLHKHGQLRGCIGNIIGQQPVYLTVRDMAIEAAVSDPRFPNVSADELQEIEIEVSVLSVPKQVEDVNEIKMGTHGVIVEKGFANGVFLPQVATETGWTREEFLANLCAQKAGLSPDAWKDKNTRLLKFTAQVFAEE